MFEVQRRIYANWIEQQKKIVGVNEEEQRRSQMHATQQQIQRDYAKLAQSLKQELINGVSNSIDKVGSRINKMPGRKKFISTLVEPMI